MESTSATKGCRLQLGVHRSAVPAVTGKDQDFSLVWLLFLAVLRNVVNDSHGYDFRMLGIEVPSVSDRVRDFNQIIYSSHLPTEGGRGGAIGHSGDSPLHCRMAALLEYEGDSLLQNEKWAKPSNLPTIHPLFGDSTTCIRENWIAI